MTGQVMGKFFSTYSGKDKFARTIQYGARYLEVRISQTDPDSALGARLLKLHKSLSVNRKAFRLCRWVNDYQKLKKAWNSDEKDIFKKFFRVLAEFGFMIYSMHDNVNWARAINVIDVEHQPIKDRQTYFRLTGAVAEFFYRLLVIRDNYASQAKICTQPTAITPTDTAPSDTAHNVTVGGSFHLFYLSVHRVIYCSSANEKTIGSGSA